MKHFILIVENIGVVKMEKATIGPVYNGFSIDRNGVTESYKVSDTGVVRETMDKTEKVLLQDKFELRPSSEAGAVIVNDAKSLKIGELKKITPNISAEIAEKLKTVMEKAARALKK